METSEEESQSSSVETRVSKSHKSKIHLIPVLVGNVIFLDSIEGDDKTAQVQNMNQPFLTLKAANKAAGKLAQIRGLVQIRIQPGFYQIGTTKLRPGVSIIGSGQFVTRLFGQFNTQKVNTGQETAVLELDLTSTNQPAILGLGTGRATLRRMHFTAQYVDNSITDQVAATLRAGNHVFSETEATLNSNGGTSLALYENLAGQNSVERGSHVIAVAGLTPVTIPPGSLGTSNKAFTIVGDYEFTFTVVNSGLPTNFTIYQNGGTTTLHGRFAIPNQNPINPPIFRSTLQIKNTMTVYFFSQGVVPYGIFLNFKVISKQTSSIPQSIAVYRHQPGSLSSKVQLVDNQVYNCVINTTSRPTITTANNNTILLSFTGDIIHNSGSIIVSVTAASILPIIDPQGSPITNSSSERFTRLSNGRLQFTTAKSVIIAAGITTGFSVAYLIVDNTTSFLTNSFRLNGNTSSINSDLSAIATSNIDVLVTDNNTIVQLIDNQGFAIPLGLSSPLIINTVNNNTIIFTIPFLPLFPVIIVPSTNTTIFPILFGEGASSDTPFVIINNSTELINQISNGVYQLTNIQFIQLISQSLIFDPPLVATDYTPPNTLNSINENHKSSTGAVMQVNQSAIFNRSGIFNIELNSAQTITVNPPTNNLPLALRIDVTTNAIGSKIISTVTLVPSDPGNPNQYTLNRIGRYTIDNFLSPNNFIIKFSGQVGSAFVNVAGPTTSNVDLQALDVSKPVLEDGSQIDYLQTVTTRNANIHIDDVTVHKSSTIPESLTPTKDQTKFPVQRIGTRGQHYLGGSQVQSITASPITMNFVISPSDGITSYNFRPMTQLTVTLPNILGSGNNFGVEPGTIYYLYNVSNSGILNVVSGSLNISYKGGTVSQYSVMAQTGTVLEAGTDSATTFWTVFV